jgi:hypothetical protein
MAREMTDAEVFGAAPAELSDADVFGAPRVGAPIGRMGRFMQGMGDLPAGFEQFLANVIPDSVKGVVNRATEYGKAVPAFALTSQMVGQVAPQEEANAKVTEREADYQARLKASGVDGTDWARVGGQVVSSLPAALIPGANTFMGAAGIGALTGAGLSGLSPVPDAGDNYAYEAAKNAALGGVGGAVGGVAGKALGSMIAPRIDPNVRTLADAGVELTPGQIVGGTARRMEDAATSIPIVGTGVANAQRRSLESFNRAVGNEVLAPIGQTVPKNTPAGRALIGQVDDAISNAYSAAHAKVTPFAPDAQFVQDFQGLLQNNILMPDQKAFFTSYMQRQLLPRMQKGQIDGATLQEISSELKRYARTYMSSQAVPDRELGGVFRGMVNLFDDLTARTNPGAAPDIKQSNAAFARLIRMEGATGATGAAEGVFTAPQFQAAVRRSDMSPRKGEFARGRALMQDLSDPARAVLPATVPDSGTPLRSAVGLLAGAGTSGMIDPALAASYLGATAAGRMAYSEPATRAFRALMLARRPASIGLMGEGVRRGGQASGYGVRGLMNEELR